MKIDLTKNPPAWLEKAAIAAGVAGTMFVMGVVFVFCAVLVVVGW